jgi:hypothetical protein
MTGRLQKKREALARLEAAYAPQVNPNTKTRSVGAL